MPSPTSTNSGLEQYFFQAAHPSFFLFVRNLLKLFYIINRGTVSLALGKLLLGKHVCPLVQLIYHQQIRFVFQA